METFVLAVTGGGRHGVSSTASACHVSGCHACWLRVME
ncbi:hypothetical protein LHGZ1_0760 [Laribacter hongkongensis]|uniref:Uncharacterized protein n=1 Tax=Laribacter hongkongensis TaxID=168471 RepID=A0A248LGG6_9NEIS|nr:hypothetical protein LHGZ1_0760 [Laribacter hongkongensis]